jgi:RNA polymerase sigma-70 factor (ECF subfamily)
VLSETSATATDRNLPLESDQVLMEAISRGDQNAFADLYKRYQQQIFCYLLRILQDNAGAEDVLQEVFLAVWQGSGKFKHRSSVKTWIYRIAYKRSISWLRKYKRKSNPIPLAEVIDTGAGPEETAMSAIQHAQLKSAMAGLPPKHRAVLELAFAQDMSYPEIAEVLNCPIGTVKSRMSYALRNLNQILRKTGSDHWRDAGEEM